MPFCSLYVSKLLAHAFNKCWLPSVLLPSHPGGSAHLHLQARQRLADAVPGTHREGVGLFEAGGVWHIRLAGHRLRGCGGMQVRDWRRVA